MKKKMQRYVLSFMLFAFPVSCGLGTSPSIVCGLGTSPSGQCK